MMATKKVVAGKVTVRRSPMEHPRHQYPAETVALREIVLGCGLEETIKWGKPCFVQDGRNVVLMQRFNAYVALMFFQGALLKDAKKVLHKVGEMEAPRQMRFAAVAEVERLRPVVAAYVREAMALEAAGAKVPRKAVGELAVPAELQARLDGDRRLKAAFAALTPGRQKHYIYEIGAAKQASTRAARVEKYVPTILAGKGLRD